MIFQRFSSSGNSSSASRDPALRVLARERVRRHAEVVLDRQPGQQAPALGDDRDAGAAHLLGPRAREVLVAEQHAAALARSTPPTASTSVDLPAPFGPSSVVISPGGIVERHVVQHAAAAARDAELLEAQLGPVALRRVALSPRSSRRPPCRGRRASRSRRAAPRPSARWRSACRSRAPRSSSQHAETRLMSWSTRITSAPNCSGILLDHAGQVLGLLVGQARRPARRAARPAGAPTTARAISTRRRSRAPSPPTLTLRRHLEADVLDRARARRPAATRGPLPECSWIIATLSNTDSCSIAFSVWNVRRSPQRARR